MRLLLGFIFPTSGAIRIFGEERVLAAHSRVGYVHEHSLFEARFTGRECLAYLARLSGLHGRVNRERVEAALEAVGLASAARRVATYSKGMLQRLAIAAALLSDPDLLILDEPTSGLDPASQHHVRRILAALHAALHAQVKTLLVCSHYLAEVEELCTSVAILRRGRLVAHGPVVELTRGEDVVEMVLAGEESAAEVVSRLDLAEHVREAHNASLRVPAASQQAVLAALLAGGVALRSLNPVARTLEDVYLRVSQPAKTAPWEPVASVVPASESGRRPE